MRWSCRHKGQGWLQVVIQEMLRHGSQKGAKSQLLELAKYLLHYGPVPVYQIEYVARYKALYKLYLVEIKMRNKS